MALVFSDIEKRFSFNILLILIETINHQPKVEPNSYNRTDDENI